MPPWVLIEQNEGLLVELILASPGVEVVFVDYDEAKNNRDYAATVLAEVRASGLPPEHRDRVVASLLAQRPDLTVEAAPPA
jgi:hypothetical protein